MIRTRFLLQRLVVPKEIVNSFVNFAVLQTYKRINGTLKIDPNYVVGKTNEDAILWPRHYLGFKLGSYARFITSNLKKGLYNNSIVENLIGLGFQYTPDQKSDEVILLAAHTYLRVYNSAMVPFTFRVPVGDPNWPSETHGVGLGRFLKIMKNDSNYRPALRQSLMNAGISFESLPACSSSDAIVMAASTFVELFGSTCVPVKFVVPLNHPDWPEETWGIKLGSLMDTMRSRENCHRTTRDTLKQMGFTFTRPVSDDVYLSAISTFKTIHNHVQIPTNYSVPLEDDRYSANMHGLALGQWLESRIKRPSRFPKIVSALRELGLDFTREHGLAVPFTTVRAALVTYYSINGHMKVPTRFRVTFGDPLYEDEAWDMPLGRILRDWKVKQGSKWDERREQLAALGVDISMRSKAQALSFEQLYDALVVYKMIYNHLNISVSYTIPLDDVRYPEDVRGIKLGAIIRNIRNDGQRKQHRDALLALGVNLAKNPTSSDFDRVYDCLEAYKRIHGHLLVPHGFRIPQGDARYPEGTGNYGLGHAVTKIRVQNYYSEHRDELLLLGFDFADDYMTKVVGALTTFKQLHGHLNVPYKLVISAADEQYPKELHGLNVGIIVSKYRKGVLREQYKEALEQAGLEL